MDSSSLNVLVVDDDAEIGFMLKAILDFNGYHASICSDATDIFNLLATNKPDLIIMDMLLSGADGREICRKLKNSITTKEIPVLMISAHPDGESTCKAAGANQFIAKPFEIKELLRAVRSHLNDQALFNGREK
ncbi:MAG TPA: response regulator transcription factor [Puia sp.]|nr:response regulator transcription factor [Puia sp.]